MHAREKSNPLDRRGNTEAGEPYMCEESSFGERGTRFPAAIGLPNILEGICSDSPCVRRSGLWGVAGAAVTAISSLVRWMLEGFGETEEGVLEGASERERAFVGDRLAAGVSGPVVSFNPVIFCWSCFVNWLPDRVPDESVKAPVCALEDMAVTLRRDSRAAFKTMN